MTNFWRSDSVPLPLPAGQLPATGSDEAPTVSLKREAWKRFTTNRMALFSLVVMILLLAAATFAPLLSSYDPMAIDVQHNPLYSGPSSSHWFGTDGLGRDIGTRILYGLRGPLFVALAGSILCTFIGAFTGILAGMRGGWVDSLLSRVTEIIFVIPGLLLLIFFLTFFGDSLKGLLGPVGRLVMVMIFIATDSWPFIMRLARGETLALKHSLFVEAARVSGTSQARILTRHMLPNMWGILLVQGGLLLSGFIYVTSGLAIFGLARPDLPDVGQMLLDGTQIAALQPVILLAPACSIVLISFCATFIGDGLRDAFDTRAL